MTTNLNLNSVEVLVVSLGYLNYLLEKDPSAALEFASYIPCKKGLAGDFDVVTGSRGEAYISPLIVLNSILNKLTYQKIKAIWDDSDEEKAKLLRFEIDKEIIIEQTSLINEQI